MKPETESLNNRLEWMSIDKLRILKQQGSSENLRHTDQKLDNYVKKTSYSQTLSLPDIILTCLYSFLTILRNLLKISKIIGD